MSPPTLASATAGTVRQRLHGEGLALHLPPFTVQIKSVIPVVATGLTALYADYALAPQRDAFIDFHVSVVQTRRWPRPLCVFTLDGLQPFTPLAAGEAFALLEWGLNWCVTGYCHTFVTVHAAILERAGRAVILPAPPGSGKSTLCAALMLAGWRLLSDEMALLDPATGLFTPSPRPVSLKNQSIEVIRQRAPQAVMGPVAHDTLKGTVAHLRPSLSSVQGASRTAQPGWVVFPKYEAGAATQPVARPRAASLMQLTENSFNRHVHGRQGFEALAEVVARSDCYDLTYSRLDEALAWFDQLAPAA